MKWGRKKGKKKTGLIFILNIALVSKTNGRFENPDVSSSTTGYLLSPSGDVVWSYAD